MSAQTDQQQVAPAKYNPHSPITLPLAIIPATNNIYKSQPIPQPFRYEVFCPISCAGIKIGVHNQSQTSDTSMKVIQFRTTTARTVQASVNNSIVYTVNNHKPQNKEKKKTQNMTDYGIALKVDFKSNIAILNPYYLTSDPLSLYTLEATKATQKGQKLTFKQMQFESDHFEIEGRKIFYSKNRVCYRPIFNVPTLASSTIIIADPTDRNRFVEGKISQLKATINGNISYWLTQLSSSYEVYHNSQLPPDNLQNIDDIFTQLGYWLDLDEQVRCQLLDFKCAKVYEQLYPNFSRLYTSFYRLSSFLNYGNTRYNVVKLAELGFFNRSDLLQNLAHYEDPKIPIANIQEAQIISEEDMLKKNFPHLRSLNNLPFPNVPLSVSLNSMCPQTHNGSEIVRVAVDGYFFGFLSNDKIFSLWSGEMILLNYVTFNLATFVKRKQIRTENVCSTVAINSSDQSNIPTKCEQMSDLFNEEKSKQIVKQAEEVVIPDNNKLQQLVNMGFPVELCKKALVSTKNQSIQAVLDCIQQIKSQEDIKRKKKLQNKKLKLKESWVCEACTFSNSSDSCLCTMCDSPAPFEEYIVQEQEQKELQNIKKWQAQKAQQEKKRLKEKQIKQKKMLEEQVLKKQKEAEISLQKFVLQAKLIDLKICYIEKCPLDPFFVVVLLRGQNKSLLRVFRIGLDRSYIQNFLRRQSDNTLVSTFNQSIKSRSFESVSQIIRQARRAVHWGRKFFEGQKNEWVVQQTQDLFFDELITSLTLKQMKQGISLTLQHQQKKSYVDLTIKDSKQMISFELKKCVDHSQQRNIKKSQISSVIDPTFLDIRCHKIQYTQNNSVIVPAGYSYFQLEVIEHLPKGQFTLKQKVLIQKKCEDGQQPLMKNFLPLRLQNFEGSIASEKLSVASLFQPGPLYVSNYSLANFAFKSIQDKQMVIETVTIISQFKSANSGYPIKSGLIFIVDQLSWFYLGKDRFQNFSIQSYNNWLAQKGNSEPLQWQPVGAFELQENQKCIQFDLSFKRPGKIICLLPTGIRKGKVQFADASVIIDFFGVKGKIIEENRNSYLKTSFSSQIQDQGFKRKLLKFYVNAEKDQQINDQDIQILQKSQLNGINFITNVDDQAFNRLETSVTNHIVVRVKKLTSSPIQICHNGHGKLVSMRIISSLSISENKLLGLNEDSKNFPSEVHEAITVNPFLVHDIVSKMDIKKFLTGNLLAQDRQLFQAWKLINIFRKNTEFQERLIENIEKIMDDINQENIKVTPEGLKYFLRLFKQLSIKNKPKTVDIIMKIWNSTSDFVKKNRNSSYRILRNKYKIKQLVLQKRLFSQFYHNIINPQLPTVSKRQNKPSQLPKNTIEAYMKRNYENTSTTMYLRLKKIQNVKKIRLYFQKTNAKYKLRIKLLKVDRISEKSYKKSLIYHRVWDEHLMLQLGNYAYTPESEIYQSDYNYFDVENLNIQAQYFIFEVHYTLIGSFYKKKKDFPTETANVLPIFFSSQNKFQSWSDGNAPIIQGNFQELFSLQKDSSNYKISVIQEGLPIYKMLENGYYYIIQSQNNLLQKQQETRTNVHADEIVANIMNKQLVAAKKSEIDFRGCYGAKGLDFSYTFLIMINKFISGSFVKEQLKSRGKSLTQTLLKMFDTFVVHQIGPICQNVMNIIVELLQMVDKVQLNRFVIKVVQKYLTNVDSLRNKPITEQYQVQHVIAKLQTIKQLPLAQLLCTVNNNSSKFEKISVFELVQHSLNNKKYELEIYDLQSNQLIKKSDLKSVLDRLFILSLGLIDNKIQKSQSDLQINLLKTCLGNMLCVLKDLYEKPEELKIVVDQFLITHSKENLWILIFNALKLPDQKLTKQINILMRDLITNANTTFNESINKMISQIIDKSQNSLYMRINGQVSNQIWMKHLQSMLQFLIKSQKEGGDGSNFHLNYETADNLLKLPLTTALWSFALSILPVDEKIIKRLISRLTPELYSFLEVSIMKYTENFKVLEPLKYAGKNWLYLAKKLMIEEKSLTLLFVDIINDCSFGGREAVLMANQNKVKDLQIAHSILQGVIAAPQFDERGLTPEKLRILIQWYMLNKTTEAGQSPATDLIKSISDNILKLFSKFQVNQELIKLSLRELLELKKSTEMIERLCKEKVLSSYNSIALTQRICDCFEQLISLWMTTDNLAHYFAFDLNGYDYLFGMIGKVQQIKESTLPSDEDIFLDSLNLSSLDKDKPEKKDDIPNPFANQFSDYKQEQLANKVKLIKQPGQTLAANLQDWSSHKKGVKNKILTAAMTNPYENQYPIVIQLDRLCELKYLRLGILTADSSNSTTQGNMLVATPSSIFLEGGQEINNFEPLGQLIPINDEGYVNFSVKVFVKNFQTVQNDQDIRNSIKSLSSRKIKFLKLTFRRPIVTFMEGVSTQTGKPYKTLAFCISFLSITGYDLNKIPSSCQKRCNDVCKKTSLVVLSQLFNQSFISTINKLSNEPTFVEKVTNNFKQITALMTQHGDLISSINYILGANNEQLGDWMIEYYLKNGVVEKHSKLISQILLSNASKIYPRLQLLLNRLLQNISNVTKLGKTLDGISKFSQTSKFLETFCNSVYSSLSTANPGNSLQLKLDQQDVDNILSVYDSSHTTTLSSSLIQFMLTLIYIKPPYVLSNDLIEYTLNKIYENCTNEKIHFYQFLNSLVISKKCKSWLEKDNNIKIQSVISQLFKSISQNKLKLLKVQLSFLIESSLHLSQYMLEKHNLHTEIYNRIKQKSFTTNQIYNLSVKLIQRIIFNNPGSEKAFVEHMTKDLESLTKRKDPHFLKFYMDLLGIQEENYVNIKGLSNIPKQDFTIPSQLLSKNQQIVIVKEIAEKSKYSLIVSIDQDCDSYKRNAVVNAMVNPPFLVLAQFSDTQNNRLLVGAYCGSSVVISPDDDFYELTANPKNFLFSLEQDQKQKDKIKHKFIHNDGTERFGSYCSEEEQCSIDFYQYNNQVLKLSFTEELQSFQTIVPQKKHYKVNKIQFWDIKHLNSQTKVNVELSQVEIPLSYYRPEPIYIVPAHITTEKLLQMIGVSSRLFCQGKQVQKDKPISTYSETTDDFIIDMELNLPSYQVSTINKKYIPRMLLYNQFERQKGADRLFDICIQCINLWGNEIYKKRWSKFIEDFHCLKNIPNLLQILVKNVNIFTIVIDIMLGSPQESKFTKQWPDIQSKLNIFFYEYINSLLTDTRTEEVRRRLIDQDLLKVVLNKLAVASKETIRKSIEEQPEQESDNEKQKLGNKPGLAKPLSEKQIKRKKKGIGYGSDSLNNNNVKWNTIEYIENKKQMSEEILRSIRILIFFLDTKEPIRDKRIPEIFKESCLLPLIENALRSSSILDISKQFNLFMSYLDLIKGISKSPVTIGCLLPLDQKYKPPQNQSIFNLLGKLKKTADIYISCLQTMIERIDKNAEQIGLEIRNTYNQVQDAVQKMNYNRPEEQMQQALKLPLPNAYKKLLGPLRFDYVSMKQGDNYKHYHSNLINNSSAIPPPVKTLRLSQQLADLSSSLPYEHTNSIFVRCDKDRIDVIRALIMGSKDTPYSNGAFLFDVFCQDTYPNQPPKMVITTTGGAKIRFNPNLYADGKVCLSLLGTWKGQTTQNWDPKLSTLLQLFISTQSIIMSEDVYFNQPGYEGEQGQVEGEKKNEGYSNIVRLGNIKFAMIQQIKNPPKGFEEVIHRHFFLKKKQILEECEKWMQYADTKQAAYTNLTHDHNVTWSTDLKKSKTAYKDQLSACIKQLREVLDKLQEPKFVQNIKTIQIKKTVKQEQDIKGEKLQDIDMTYEKQEADKELNYQDEKVKDRWSRYIGAMGLQAVKKQAESEVLLIGLGTLGLQIAKNLILSGLKRLTVVDNELIKSHTEHFYLSDMPGEYRYKCIFKLQQLNRYVKVDHSKTVPDVKPYSLIIDTRSLTKQIIDFSNQCRKLNKMYITVETKGVYGRIFNDFGQKFEVTDTNGEEPVQILIKSISNQEKGVVKLPEGFKHPYEDGQYVVIDLVEGMEQQQKELEEKSEQQIFYQKQTGAKVHGINGRVFKIEVINSNSFRIGNTIRFKPYIRNGIAKNLKLPKFIQFKSFEQSIKSSDKFPFDQNMSMYDFDKIQDNTLIHLAFENLGQFLQLHKKLPSNWNHLDAEKFVQLNKKSIESLVQNIQADKKQEQIKKLKEFFYNFSLVAESQLPAIDAYLGGLAAQQAIKAITNKFTPIKQLFTFHFKELLPQIPQTPEQIQKLHIKSQEPFFNSKIILGNSMMEKLSTSNVFVVGAGAIGCQLLKNFAMMNLCSSGTLTVTDPDHIETSNLNRQFLFREKHIRKPKSSTASAAILQMNPLLKGHVIAKLQKACEVTQNIFSDKFFKSLSLVANALDNVQARLYIDRRCVSNKIPLLESGTLGPKGHVQVIIPDKTQSYGSQNDPVEQNQIPHCTLKLFPEDTLHCIEWSRDIFGKIFTLRPKALKKILQDYKANTFNPNQEGVDKLLRKAKNAPKDFNQCIFAAVKKFYKYFRNDIRQLLHTYPLTLKTKEGEPFWKLPKRPPTEISELDEKDELHRVFISSYAVNIAKSFNISYPKNFRTKEGKQQIMKIAVTFKIPDFVASEQGSKKINELNQQETSKSQLSEPLVPIQQPNLSIQPPIQIKPTDYSFLANIHPSAEQFQKDDDMNGHIDLIYSMANLRSRNYTLAPYTWILTKLKAGRIMPALSTTTTVISALQSIQLIKIIKNSQHPKNTFANLAVPLIQMSQPGVAQKTKIGNTEFTVWDRWEMKANTLKQLYESLEEKYEVQPVDSLISGVVVYMKVLYKEKAQQQQLLMNRPLRQLLGLQKQDSYVDFTISFKDKKTGHALQSVPLIRVFIQ